MALTLSCRNAPLLYPTAARLVGALSLAVLAFIVSGLIKQVMPEGINFGYFTYVNMGLGAVVGWKLIGDRVGRGTVSAINNGLTGAAVLVLLGLFVQGAVEMFRLAHRHVYHDPFEALAAIFTIALDYFFTMAVPNILITLAIGGTIVGLMAEVASKRWK